jgi:2-alkenal reductase
VTGATDLEVVFANGERRGATVIGTDVDSDLAVIRVDSLPDGVQPLPLGDSNSVQVGQFVIAIGNPFGEAGSLSLGVVSGLGRSLASDRIAEGGGRYSLPQVIQTDAAINPGNSGGPLLNLAGEVIGVNSAISTSTGTNSGVGFSIPVNAVSRVAPALIAEGVYHYPYMGIRMTTLDLEAQESLGLPQAAGAYVTDLTPGSPAEDAGIRASGFNESVGALPGGDLIIAVNGLPIATPDDLISYLVFDAEVGQTITLTIIREGQQIEVPMTLGERP